ncbi:MAG TPA: lytic murein transglycosylase [Gammaproteobacteria bacterium]|nr:lytic murein transglycosylase [Gammaproteobacteria bacterium]
MRNNLYRANRRLSAAALAVLLVPGVTLGATPFAQCLARLKAEAVHGGISPATADAVLATVHERPRVISADRNQPEFVETLADYLQSHVSSGRVERGRDLLHRYAPLLARLEAQYGVPPQYLVAFWGLETDYGRVLGDVPVFDSLATLACDTRRGDYFAGEFVNALEIADRGIPSETMTGSWAGAMGHTQFMPSVYLADAVDGDGDGVVDLWRSVPDAFASAANFLRSLGWKRGWRWGREVQLPAAFDYYQAGLDHSKSLADWRRAGVRAADGRLIEAYDEPASLLLPAGQKGPAFLVYANFRTIMRWNHSELFALAAARLADRIAGSGPLHRPPPDQPKLSRVDVEAVQRALAARGFPSGEPDGIAGPATRRAVRDWQRTHRKVADGYIGVELLDSLGIKEMSDEQQAGTRR